MATTDLGHHSFFGWPGGRNLAYAYLVLGPLLLGWFVFVYAGADYVAGLHSYRAPLYVQWELAIPLVPVMVLVYNSLHLAYSIAPFILRTRPEMNALAMVWVLITALGGIFFLTMPFEVGYPEPPAGALGPWRAMYQLADDANLTFNSFPSLHVAWSIVCVDVYAGKARRLGKLLLWLWGIGMMLSTLLTHFHHVSDVVGGFLLAMLGSRVLYPWLLRKFQHHVA
jgi:membrane-associated phospholipid phosphatase